MSFIDHYETQLVQAGHRRLERRPLRRLSRWLRIPRNRNTAAVLAALLVGAPATAATVGWNPFDDPGRRLDTSPTTTTRAPVPELTRILAPLRRAQTPVDRGRATSLAAQGFGDDVSGVQLDYIRVLDRARGIVLVPVERFGLVLERHVGPPQRPADFSNAVCLYMPSPGGQARRPCYTAAQIESGFAVSTEAGGPVILTVPDGVASVRLIRGDRSVEAPVHANLVVAEPPAPVPALIEWRDASGNTIKRIDVTQRPRG
jgi:hypothetical protein